MAPLDQPLSDEEIDRLNRFLIERNLEEAPIAEDGTRYTGIADISELDGFLTAIISSPRALGPSDWLPVLWGESEPQWEGPDESEAILSLMLRHMNTGIMTLEKQPEAFVPIVLEEEGIAQVEEWCLGYMKGVGLAAEEWRVGGDEVMEILFPIMVFTSESGRARLDELDAEELETLKRSIPEAVHKLHVYWRKNRGKLASSHQPFVHDQPMVGRNDPCPCGSGKKFKKCCLH